MTTKHVSNQERTRSIALVGLVAALYVALTMTLPALAYGAVQLRLSEGLNHLAVFNKRYILALSIGVFIVNILSPMGIVDMVFGTLGTLVMTTMSYYSARYFHNIWIKLAVSTVIDTAMMWVVALELNLYAGAPFWITYGWVALGEFIALVIGAVIIGLIGKRVNLAR